MKKQYKTQVEEKKRLKVQDSFHRKEALSLIERAVVENIMENNETRDIWQVQD